MLSKTDSQQLLRFGTKLQPFNRRRCSLHGSGKSSHLRDVTMWYGHFISTAWWFSCRMIASLRFEWYGSQRRNINIHIVWPFSSTFYAVYVEESTHTHTFLNQQIIRWTLPRTCDFSIIFTKAQVNTTSRHLNSEWGILSIWYSTISFANRNSTWQIM